MTTKDTHQHHDTLNVISLHHQGDSLSSENKSPSSKFPEDEYIEKIPIENEGKYTSQNNSTNNSTNNNDVTIDIKDYKSDTTDVNKSTSPPRSVTSGITTTSQSPKNNGQSRIRDSCKNIIKNMLKTRSRNNISNNSNTGTPESILDTRNSPSVDRKPYELEGFCDPNLWTDETVQQIIDFGEICTISANKCKKSSIKHRRIGNFFQITIIILGALTAAVSIGSTNNDSKLIISTICGTLIAVLTSVHGFLKYPQRTEIEAHSCLELERMSRSVRVELSKAKEFRIDPYKYIIKLENQREKILRRIGIDDD